MAKFGGPLYPEYTGIDELSYRRHHAYLRVVVDHVQQRVVWVCQGKNVATVGRFFDALGSESTARLKCVTVDMSAASVRPASACANPWRTSSGAGAFSLVPRRPLS